MSVADASAINDSCSVTMTRTVYMGIQEAAAVVTRKLAQVVAVVVVAHSCRLPRDADREELTSAKRANQMRKGELCRLFVAGKKCNKTNYAKNNNNNNKHTRTHKKKYSSPESKTGARRHSFEDGVQSRAKLQRIVSRKANRRLDFDDIVKWP